MLAVGTMLGTAAATGDADERASTVVIAGTVDYVIIRDAPRWTGYDRYLRDAMRRAKDWCGA